jgi:hypothetical protein
MITRRALLGGTAVFASSRRAFPQRAAQEHCGPQTQPGADQIYYDRNGLIAQQNCDGGDTAQREGWYWLGRTVRTANNLGTAWPERDLPFEQVMTKLEIGKTGTFRRNPDKWNDPADFTRDQTVPIVAAMGIRNDKLRLQRFYQELRRRNWFAQKQGDEMTTPIYRNLVARARDEAPNSLTDAGFLYAAVQARILGARGNMDDVGDDLNLIVILLLATVRRSNAGVDNARSYYSKNRPDNYGMFLGSYRAAYGTNWEGKTSEAKMAGLIDDGIRANWKPDCPRILGALRWYFRAETGGSPGLAELYAPIIQQWFQ